MSRQDDIQNANRIIRRAIEGPLSRKMGEKFIWRIVADELKIYAQDAYGSRMIAIENQWVEQSDDEDEVLLTALGMNV